VCKDQLDSVQYNLPKRSFRPYDTRDYVVEIDAEFLSKYLKDLKENKQEANNMKKQFKVGEEVFSTLYGYGVVLETDKEDENDIFPVMVEFPGNNVQFFNEQGFLDAEESSIKTLFSSRYEAVQYIDKHECKKNMFRFINLYSNGSISIPFNNEISASESAKKHCAGYEGKNVTLVRTEKIEWSVLV
jgi:hypothetical protein